MHKFLEKHNHLRLNQEEIENIKRGFPAGIVVKNPPANAGDTGLSPAPGSSNMSQSN